MLNKTNTNPFFDVLILHWKMTQSSLSTADGINSCACGLYLSVCWLDVLNLWMTAAESGEEGAISATTELLPLVQRVSSGEALTAWIPEPQRQAAALVRCLRHPGLQHVHGNTRITWGGHAHSCHQEQCQRYGYIKENKMNGGYLALMLYNNSLN